MVAKWLFRLARSRMMGKFVGYWFQYGSLLLPVKKVFTSSEVVSFFHPRPSYPNHLLLVPKRAIRSLNELAQRDHHRFFLAILAAAREVASQQGMSDYVLCSNGGARQDVMQVHFHLFAGNGWANAPQDLGSVLLEDDRVIAYNHPQASWETHLVIESKQRLWKDVIEALPAVVESRRLLEDGYTVVVPAAGDGALHLIAGKWRGDSA